MFKNALLKFLSVLFINTIVLQEANAQIEYRVYAGTNYSFLTHANYIYFHTPFTEDHTVDHSESIELRGVAGINASHVLSPRFSLNFDLGLESRSVHIKFFDYETNYIMGGPVTQTNMHFLSQYESYSARLGLGLNWFIIKQKLFLSLGLSNNFIFKSDAWHTTNLNEEYEGSISSVYHVLNSSEIINYNTFLNLSAQAGLGIRFNKFDFEINYYAGFTSVPYSLYNSNSTRKGLLQNTMEFRVGYCLNRN